MQFDVTRMSDAKLCTTAMKSNSRLGGSEAARESEIAKVCFTVLPFHRG